MARQIFYGMILAILLTLTVSIGAQEPVEAEVVPDFLFVRANPSANASQLGTYSRGTVLSVQARETNSNDGGSWVYVTPVGGGTSGWVLVNFLLFPDNYNIGVLPVKEGAAAPVSSTGQPASTGGTTSTVGAGVGLSAETKEYANLREGPELTFDVIRQLPPDRALQVIGRNANAVWLQVAEGSDIGWVFYALITVEGNVNSLPVTSGQPAPPVRTTEDGQVVDPAPVTTTSSNAAGRPTTLGQNLAVVGGDGRLNSHDDLGGILIFCVDANSHTNTGTYAGGGIVLYAWQSQQIVFFASEGQINNAGTNAGIHGENGYTLGRDVTGDFLLYGKDASDKEFIFRWSNCSPGSRQR